MAAWKWSRLGKKTQFPRAESERKSSRVAGRSLVSPCGVALPQVPLPACSSEWGTHEHDAPMSPFLAPARLPHLPAGGAVSAQHMLTPEPVASLCGQAGILWLELPVHCYGDGCYDTLGAKPQPLHKSQEIRILISAPPGANPE